MSLYQNFQFNVARVKNFAMITTMKRTDIGIVFDDRLQVGTRNLPMQSLRIGPSCPALSKTKFGVHAIGDTHGPNRRMDTLVSHGTLAFSFWTASQPVSQPANPFA
jgi:hypothetical protein